MSNVDEITKLVLKEPKQDGGDYSGYDLKGVSLNGATFVYATLVEVNMDDSELLQIDFSQASLEKSSMKNSKLKNLDFNGANLEEVNFEEKFYGPTSLREALAHSRNVVTVKLMQKIGIKSTIRLAKSLGISSNLEENLSISLGSSGMTLYELVSAYSAFANMGNLIKPTAIRNIKSRNGEVLFTSIPEITQPIAPGTAHIITSLLESVVQNGTATKVKALKRPVAGKTGTTNNYVDAWFMGYTPQLVTGVWVGKDKDEPLGKNETGSRAAIPIWLQFMQEALANKPIKNFPVPSDIQFLKVQSKSGVPAKYDDTDSNFEIFSQDFLPEKEQPFTSIIQTEDF